MHMFLTFYRNTLVSLGVHWLGFISSVGICPTSWSNQLPKLGDHERLYSENNSWELKKKNAQDIQAINKIECCRSQYKFAASRTLNLLPKLFWLFHPAEHLSSCWIWDILMSSRCRSWCKPALGAGVQHHCTGTLQSIPWCLSLGGRGFSKWFWHGYTCRWLWRTSAYSMAVFLPLFPMNMYTPLIQSQELPTAP